MRIIIIFFLLTSMAWAQPAVIFDKTKPEFIHYKGKKYSVKNIPLTAEYTHRKPLIDETKILTADEAEVVDFSLKENGRKLIFSELRPAKNDYQNDFDRGTVKFNPQKGKNIYGLDVFEASNYSFHKVIIPDGTIVESVNFSQRKPHTNAIQGKNLTFKNCNLVNVQIDPTWTFIDSNTAQIDRTVTSQIDNGDGTTTLGISHRVEKSPGVFEEADVDEEMVDNIDLSRALLRYQP